MVQHSDYLHQQSRGCPPCTTTFIVSTLFFTGRLNWLY